MSTVNSDIVRIAGRRLHLITDDEVKRLGLNERSVRRLVRIGQLHRVADGVLATHEGPLTVPQRELAICLSISDAVLSHASAASIWGLRRAPKDRVEVTVPHGRPFADRRAVVHYSNRLPDHHVVDLIDGARVTSVARTVFDLGGVMDEAGHLSVIEDVRNKGLCIDAELGEVYQDLCGCGRRGSAAWQRLVQLVERTGRPVMSELELEFHGALIADGLPPAVQQHPVTLPSGRTGVPRPRVPGPARRHRDRSRHATASAVEQDKARDLGLAVLGWERLRFTERAIERRLSFCVAVVRGVIELRAPYGRHPAA